MREPANDPPTDEALQQWARRDDALRARVLAMTLGRDEEGVYRTLKNLQQSPSERLRLG